jgi:hypothetical protein
MANTQGTTGLLGWIDERFPLTKSIREHLTEYYAPKNFNFWYFFGSLALLVLVNQIPDRHLADHELQALGRRRLRLGRIHHARRGLGLADPLHAFHRRLGLSSSWSTCTCIAP